ERFMPRGEIGFPFRCDDVPFKIGMAEHPVEHIADIVVDRRPQPVDRLINLGEPVLEFGKDAGELSGGSMPLHHIPFEPACELLMCAPRDYFVFTDSKPITNS